MKENKTNAMRILDKENVNYQVKYYDCGEFIDGLHVADQLGLNYESTFKTLVAQGKSGKYCVFVIPIAEELDLKAAAKSVSEKSVELIHVKDIKNVTGYIRGGCTAIGMKKDYPVVIDETSVLFDEIAVSGGALGVQLLLSTDEYLKVTKAAVAALTL